MTNYYTDRLFWAAILVAPLFWVLLYFFIQPQTDVFLPVNQPALFLSVALVYPVIEELIFRGLIQGALLNYWPARKQIPVSRANAITTLLFALAHVFTRSLANGLMVIVPSLIFGFFRERYQGVLIPICLHVFYNAGYIWIFG